MIAVTAIDAETLMEVWERGTNQPRILRAVLLLDASVGDQEDGTAPNTAAGLAIGERDRRLLRLRSALFGAMIEAVTRCLGCGLEIELELSADQLAVEPTSSAALGTVSGDGWTVTVRAVTSADILAVTPLPLAHATRALALRCVVAAHSAAGELLDVGTMGDDILSLIAEELSRVDPGASIDLALVCPACAAEWLAPFDVIGFVWNDFDAWARRTLADVHALARSYGWAESDILALHPRRRQHYLHLVQS